MKQFNTIVDLIQYIDSTPLIPYTVKVDSESAEILSDGNVLVTLLTGSEYGDIAAITKWIEFKLGATIWTRVDGAKRTIENIGIIKLVQVLNASRSPFTYSMVAPAGDESVTISSCDRHIITIEHRGDIADTKARLIHWVTGAHHGDLIGEIVPTTGVLPSDIENMGLGVFRIFWLPEGRDADGGSSVCCISMEADGTSAINIANWTWTGEPVTVEQLAPKVLKLELIARS